MDSDAKQLLVRMKITDVVCSTIAILSTIGRLVLRRRRLWWDDAWAFLSMLSLIVQIASVWMHASTNPADLSRFNRIAAYYLFAASFFVIIWSARISILYSLNRLNPNFGFKRMLLYISAGYLLVTMVLICQLFWVCEPENLKNHWKDMPNPQCITNKQVAVSQLVADILADLLLIIAPIRLFSALRDKKLRVRLIMIFSTCVVTTMASLVHTAYILARGGTKVLIAAIVEDCMSLFVCNIPVLATSLFKLRSKNTVSTNVSTRVFFQRKTETVVDGTIITLETFPTATHAGTDAMHDQDMLKMQGNDTSNEQSPFPVRKDESEEDVYTYTSHPYHVGV